ncbi:sensor histidine kinase NtrY-like [Saccharibacter floricola]|uniref:histidine kinase n=1 Tax=Saccharibacter floricola DSM 15669 TaxID=1123227 RepID=A0ABQ0P0X7_9PROT|nr:ATP-binding protein [Saccharibacter floricola]GBQ08632.1 two component sensor histidine kinase NtrY [Saccharibacter floricola DSM 15669]
MRRSTRWIRRFLARLVSADGIVSLTVLALFLALTTFWVLASGMSVAHIPQVQALLFLLDFITLLLIGAAAIGQIGRMQAERRMGMAGARLHVRLVTLFGVIAVAPTLMVGALSALFFHYGVEIWFSNRVNTALSEARSVAAGYLREHNENTRTEAFALANTLLTIQNDEFFAHGTDLFHAPSRLQTLLEDEVTERGLSDAIIFDPLSDKVIATGGLFVGKEGSPQLALPSRSVIAMVKAGDVAILDQPDSHVVRAVVSLGESSGLVLVITRPVDPDIMRHMQRTNTLVHNYQRMMRNRNKTQVTLILILALMGLLVLAVGMLTGLALANRIAHPLSRLIIAARRIARGDLEARVPIEGVPTERDDEVKTLSWAFNRMTDQLAGQRSELMKAYDQINERRRFTEAVLSGVSAGVIGLDTRQMVELPNRAASVILQRDLQQYIGRALVECVPEFASLLEAVQHVPEREHTAEVQIDTEGAQAPGGPGEGGGARAGRTLLVRVATEKGERDIDGYVVTFDDITVLQVAQRKAAWADVARRIAHEIKNPLTPIQLSAERLRRRFQKEITSDPDTYNQLVATIIRQVGDIGRMVDEFSSFARMPQAELARYDLVRLCQEAPILQRHAHPDILYRTEGLEAKGVMVLCDRRLIGQCLTNLLQNAADAITMTGRKIDDTRPCIGEIVLSLKVNDKEAVIGVSDNGIGLPSGERHRLIEPYVTHKPKGTGLGLAIVHRIMDAHGGRITFTDRREGGRSNDDDQFGESQQGTLVTLCLPLVEDDNIAEECNGS